MSFNINNRRYTGSKTKLVPWIKEVIERECLDATSFCDLFAGTGVVTYGLINNFKKYIINDFLYSNEIIYNAFFGKKNYNMEKLFKFSSKYKKIKDTQLEADFVTLNYANRYFSEDDALKIDYIRKDLEKNKKSLNKREFDILLSSLIYSLDRSANTVGHYDSFLRSRKARSSFRFELINPVLTGESSQEVQIFREDANTLSKKISADIVYIDPPYSSRQYSRFYHVIETIAKWDKPELFGAALKPKPENISEYSQAKAADVFAELIAGIKARYIVVSYNNTYASKSKSSKNKMSLEEIEKILNMKGKTSVFSVNHKAFNAGKTNFKDHKEFLFITKTGGE